MKAELKSQSGSTFLYLEYDSVNHWLYTNWIGYQSVDNVKEGFKEIINLRDKYNFVKILNDNRALIGPWDKANQWLEQEIVPIDNPAQVKYMAHVISPGIFGQLSVQDLQTRLQNKVDIKLFEDIKKAEEWLREQE